nr:zinc finger, HIT-type [Tanacetum cinerariifolium]
MCISVFAEEIRIGTIIPPIDVDRPCYVDDAEDVLPQSKLECIAFLKVAAGTDQVGKQYSLLIPDNVKGHVLKLSLSPST